MLIVADSSPINILIRVGCVEVLGSLFGRVIIPPQVRDELSDSKTPDSVREFIAHLPEWFEVRPPGAIEPIPRLDPGEEAAISLARETRADALLIDDRHGRREAAQRGIVIIGTLGVLERAADRGLIDLVDTVARLRTTDFRIDPKLLQLSLDRDAKRRADGEPPTRSH